MWGVSISQLIHIVNPIGALLLSLIWSLGAWATLILYLASFTSELLQSLDQTVNKLGKRLWGLAVVAADNRSIRVLLDLIIYAIDVRITISSILVVQGTRPLRSIS
jgi:hypothetical protein